MANVTINEDISSSDSLDLGYDANEIQALGNTFAKNIIDPDISQQGITLDALSYQNAKLISTLLSAQITSKIKQKIMK